MWFETIRRDDDPHKDDERYRSVTEIERGAKVPMILGIVATAIILFTVLANIIAVLVYLSW